MTDPVNLIGTSFELYTWMSTLTKYNIEIEGIHEKINQLSQEGSIENVKFQELAPIQRNHFFHILNAPDSPFIFVDHLKNMLIKIMEDLDGNFVSSIKPDNLSSLAQKRLETLKNSIAHDNR